MLNVIDSNVFYFMNNKRKIGSCLVEIIKTKIEEVRDAS
jgi:hypothetical protein